MPSEPTFSFNDLFPPSPTLPPHHQQSPSPKAKAKKPRPPPKQVSFSFSHRNEPLPKQQKHTLNYPAPWLSLPLSPSSIPPPRTLLDAEAALLLSYLTPTTHEVTLRSHIVSQYASIIKSRFPSSKTKPFGSTGTGLFLPWSDIDLIIIDQSPSTSTATNEDPKQNTQSSKLSKLLPKMRSSNHTSSIEFVRKARVPVLKMVDRVTNMNIDVCYNVLGGYQAVECVKLWVEKVPGLRELVLLVKLFLSTKDLSEVFSGGLGGYSIVSLCLAFLQLRNPITGEIEMSTSLPSKKRPHSSSSSFSSTSSTITPGQTFLQFCRFFGTQFDYHTLGIKFTPTTPIPQAHFFNKLSSPHYQPSKPYLLTLLNPLDPSTDLTKGSSKIQSVSFAFRSAIPVLERGLTASFASKKPRIVTPTRYWERDFERGDDLPTLQPVLSDPEPIQLTQATSIFSELVFISRRMVKARDLGTGVSVSLFGKDGDRGTATEVDDNEPHSSHVRFEDEDDAERDSFMIGGIMMQDSGDESDSADEEDAEFTAVLDDVEEEVELTVETVEPEKAPTLPDDSDGYIAFDFDASDSVDQYGFTIDRTPVIPLPDSLSDQTPSTTSHEPIQSQQLVRTLPPQLPSPPPQKRPPSRKSFNYRALEEKHKAKLKASKKHDKADHTRLQKEIDSSSSSKHPSPHLSKNKLRKQNAKQRSLDLSLPVSQFDEFDKFDRGGGIQKRRGKRERASSKAQTRESDWKKWERELQDDFIGFRFGGKGRSNHEGNSGKGERRKRRQ